MELPLMAGLVFPAQAEAVGRLLATSDRLAHALLVHGSRGIGKAAVATAIAKGLLCETPEGERPMHLACDRCSSCRWFDAGNHPDVKLVGLLTNPQGKTAWEISIDQIRDLQDFIGMTAFRDGARIVLIDPAETLSVPAANALLKMLEEPGARTYFLLVTHRPDSLPATVRSRCRSMPVPRPSDAEQQAWLAGEAGIPAAEAARLLAFSGGAPLHARHLADPASLTAYRRLLEAIGSLPDTGSVAVAEVVAGAEVGHWYGLLQRWVNDLVRVCAGGEPRFFPESAHQMRQLRGRCSLAGLTRTAARLQRQAVLIRHPLNPRLFAEESLGLYLDAFDGLRSD
ncbi:MAG TPA: DNA polymerase III subunit delta' [Lautropia sp.]|jgi:DNA polymerase-3 subunit delta'|nr:DNA polymerase III subunit delta' [Lautropia sp.]